ncbi:hypothetical protein D5H75_40480 [Bailinhaonella thermotolerans]|uniref:Uncharacterized protein n=2 Tax=Bailinhaonella thermotolerans TaxID=1070861 RepID=A0A3A3ZYW6_9ACTN|nr:hypothetical protein D5H75_40480 [Bailinhaonella thermotolerans]
MRLTAEPPILLALISSAVQLAAVTWLPMSDTVVSLINAAVIALAGVVTAWATRTTDNGSRVLAAIVGAAEALVALALALGWDWTPEQITPLMSLIQLAAAAWLRGILSPQPARP